MSRSEGTARLLLDSAALLPLEPFVLAPADAVASLHVKRTDIQQAELTDAKTRTDFTHDKQCSAHHSKGGLVMKASALQLSIIVSMSNWTIARQAT